ncbi:hypothetical protein L2E82_45528 [Cichorium intybus]|uniref:Uncharacterized protein n=1 Tax=Cichorium intybus TaxID=13427 RepID=A0ACB8ZTK1_CICIN|nr:hypothetical protein L2E82_45528 [Cichorium intybus]
MISSPTPSPPKITTPTPSLERSSLPPSRLTFSLIKRTDDPETIKAKEKFFDECAAKVERELDREMKLHTATQSEEKLKFFPNLNPALPEYQRDIELFSRTNNFHSQKTQSQKYVWSRIAVTAFNKRSFNKSHFFE